MLYTKYNMSAGKHTKNINGKIVCTKKPYYTKKEAKDSLRYLNLTMDDPQEKKSYHCNICSCWHLTSDTRSSRKKKKKSTKQLLTEKNKPKRVRKRKKKNQYPKNTLIGEQLKKLGFG